MSDIVPILINPTGGSVSVTIAIPNNPLSLGGTIWRYNSDESPNGNAGDIDTTPDTIPLGSPLLTTKKIYMIEGGVAHLEDKRKVFYKVVVTISQDNNELHSEIPAENGSGNIDKEDKSFLYKFQLKTP